MKEKGTRLQHRPKQIEVHELVKENQSLLTIKIYIVTTFVDIFCNI